MASAANGDITLMNTDAELDFAARAAAGGGGGADGADGALGAGAAGGDMSEEDMDGQSGAPEIFPSRLLRRSACRECDGALTRRARAASVSRLRRRRS